MNDQWIDVCAVGEIDAEDVLRFDHGPHTYAVFRSADNEFFATAGLCTHEKIHRGNLLNRTACRTIFGTVSGREHPVLFEPSHQANNIT